MKKLFTFVAMALMAISVNAQAVVAEIDWTQESEWNGMWYSTDYAAVSVEKGTGLIIDCSSDGTTNYWEPQVPMIGHLPAVKKGRQYQVIFTVNAPVSGEISLDFCSWDGTGASYRKVINVTAGEDVYIVEFEDYPTECTDAMIFYQCGKIPGRHIIKDVQVIEGVLNYEKWTIAGDMNLLGADWDVTYKSNNMRSFDGENYILKKEIRLSRGTYNYKVFKDNARIESYPSNNASLTINEDAIYYVTFSFNAKTKELSATATKADGWAIAGDESLFGVNWDASKNKMIASDGDNYTFKRTNLTLPKGTYEYKVYNRSSIQESYPGNNAKLVIEETATYTIEFTFNVKAKELSATTTKTDGLFFNYISKGKVAELIQNPNRYKGTVIIPSTITHGGEEYSVTKICDNAFNNCSGLTSVTIPNSVTSIGNSAFYNCYGLASVTIPNSVTSIENSAFSGCSGLKSVSIPNSVTSIGEYAFYNCSKLTSINIPNSVNSIGNYAFSSCSGLTSVIIPNSVTSLGSYAFQDCSGLTSLTIGKNVISIYENAFSGCNSLESIIVESGNTVYDSRNGCNAIINSEANLLILGCKKTIIPNSIISIGNYAFAGCNGLTSVVIPNGVVAIGSNAFSGCKNLTSVTIPNSVTSIGYYAFANCIKLNSMSAPNSYVNDGAFNGCSSLTSATFTGATVGSYAFANCPELKDVYYMFDVALYEKDPGFSWYIGYNIFQDSYIEYATLHVPAASLSIYKNAEPWKNFMKVVALSDSDIPETPETPKCAKPTITYNNGVITFSCETDGVEFISEVKANDNRKDFDNKIILSNTYTVSVYATKAGYDNSETVTMEVVGTGGILGDLTGDGKVDVADHVKLSDIIMKQK